MIAPFAAAQQPEITLSPLALPLYALRTTLRMLVAIAASLLFTFTYATLAAKSRRAEMVLIPLLDVLQSVPILGYLSFTVLFFVSLFPGQRAGAGARRHLRHLHQPGLEHGVQLLPVAAHGSARSGRGEPQLPLLGLAALLAAGGALRHAGPHLEHDDVDVRRLVLRRRLRGDHGRRPADRPARRRLLCRARDRASAISPPSAGRFSPWAPRSSSTISCCSARWSPGRTSSASSRLPRRSCRRSWILDLFRRDPLAEMRSVVRRRRPRSRSRRGRGSRCRRALASLIAALAPPPRLADLLWYGFVLAGIGYRAWRLSCALPAPSCPGAMSRSPSRMAASPCCASPILIVLASVDLGPDRGWGRAAAEACREGAAAGAVPRRLSGQSAFPGGGLPDPAVPPGAQDLAEPADDPRDAMVHPVQRHRRRERVSDRSPRGRGELPHPAAGAGGAR